MELSPFSFKIYSKTQQRDERGEPMSLDSSSKNRLPISPGAESTGHGKPASSSAHILEPGQVHVSPKAQSIVMTLGSGAAVCISDPIGGIGGAAHYLLPEWDGSGAASPRYGSVAIVTLVQGLLAAGAWREHLRAKVFGGGKRSPTDGLSDDTVGTRNIEVAMEILAKERIPIAYVESGTNREQRVVFQTDSGEVQVTDLEV